MYLTWRRCASLRCTWRRHWCRRATSRGSPGRWAPAPAGRPSRSAWRASPCRPGRWIDVGVFDSENCKCLDQIVKKYEVRVLKSNVLSICSISSCSYGIPHLGMQDRKKTRGFAYLRYDVNMTGELEEDELRKMLLDLQPEVGGMRSYKKK